MHPRENKPDTVSSLAGWLGSTLLDCCVEAKTEKLIRDVPPPCPTWRDSFQLLPRLHDDIRHELDGRPRVPSQAVELILEKRPCSRSLSPVVTNSLPISTSSPLPHHVDGIANALSTDQGPHGTLVIRTEPPAAWHAPPAFPCR